MVKQKRQTWDNKALLRAAERACSSVAVLEDVAWEIDALVAGELLQARQAMDRAIAYLKGQDPDDDLDDED